MIEVLSIILSLLIQLPHQPQPPQGLLDCGFSADNVYQCRP